MLNTLTKPKTALKSKMKPRNKRNKVEELIKVER